MPAVNIFLANRRFTSLEALRSYTLPSPEKPSQFLKEVELAEPDFDSIELVFNADSQPIYYLLASARDFDRWGKKVRHMLAQYNAAILVYEPNLMRTPEACSLYYMGRLVYEHLS